MNKLDMILENTCINHINMSSRLSEAAEKAINENKVEAICEAFDKTQEDMKIKLKKAKVKAKELWTQIKKFFLTLIAKFNNLIIEFRNNSKKNIEFIDKNASAIREGAKTIGTVEGYGKLTRIAGMKPTAITASVLEDIFLKYTVYDKDELEKFVFDTSLKTWDSTFNNVKFSKDDNKVEVVTKAVFDERSFNSANSIVYIKEVNIVIDEVAKALQELNKLIASADYDVEKKLGNMRNSILSDEVELAAKYYKIIVQDNIVCLRLAFELLVKSNRAVMDIAKKCIAAAK